MYIIIITKINELKETNISLTKGPEISAIGNKEIKKNIKYSKKFKEKILLL